MVYVTCRSNESTTVPKNETKHNQMAVFSLFACIPRDNLPTIAELHSYLECPYCVHAKKYDEPEHGNIGKTDDSASCRIWSPPAW